MAKTAYNIQLKGYVGGADFDRKAVDKTLAEHHSGLARRVETLGLHRGVHYVVGRKPPKTFKQPIIDPMDYEHVISFYNGSVAVIISQDRPGSSNSLTLSWLLVDDAKFIDYQKLKDETLPADG